MIITAYRISKSAYAADIWSGNGACDYPGRWNSKGIAVVYTAENRSLAAMEQLVHMGKAKVLKDFVISSIGFDDSLVERVDVLKWPTDWDNPVAPPSLKEYGDDWATTTDSPVLAVPSVVTRGEWNYLLNPAHAAFTDFVKSNPEPFVFDYRLG